MGLSNPIPDDSRNSLCFAFFITYNFYNKTRVTETPLLEGTQVGPDQSLGSILMHSVQIDFLQFFELDFDNQYFILILYDG